MDSVKCKAQSKQAGRRCKNWAVPGALVCSKHGGKAPQVAARAAERIAEDDARRTFGKLAEVSTPVGNPFEALATLAGEVTAWKNFIAGRISELAELRYEGIGSGEQLNAEISLFERALDRCVATMTAIAKLDVDKMAIRVQSRQLDLVEKAVQVALVDVGATVEQQREFGVRFAHHLRIVS